MRVLVRLLGSLHMAVTLLIAIAVVLAWGTIYETRFGTAAVQEAVYRAWWFQALLGFLALNLALAAAQRVPWKRKHTPFLLAHLGIILILVGGILGGRFGIEGQLIIPEGQAERVLQLPQNVLVVRQPNPGIPHAIPTSFESRAWVHEPQARYQVPLEHRAIELLVDRYYPNAEVLEEVTGGGEAENPAVHLAVSHEAQQEAFWLLADDAERFGARWGQAHILFLAPPPEQLAGLVGLTGSAAPRRGTVSIELTQLNVRREVPVPDDFSRPIAIEGTPYTVAFKDYFADFAITEQGIVNRSDEPVNPAVSFALSGPEGTEPFLAFALHPEFQAMHGRRHRIPAAVTYTHPAAPALPPDAICLLRHPSGALSCVLTGSGGQRWLAACEPGGTYRHPWLEYDFTLDRYEPKARLVTRVTNRDDEVRAEALHVIVRDGEHEAEAWVGRGGAASVKLGDVPLEVEYGPARRELPVTIKLLDFRKTDYPGTQMAAGFESDVQLSDPARGVILMRKISMNNPLRWRGFSFYQSSYIPGEVETTVLSVRSDPGTPFVYAGFLIVIAGVITMFILRNPAETSGANK